MAFTVNHILRWIEGSKVINLSELGSSIDEIQVTRPASLGHAKPSDLTFFFSRAFEHELHTSNPGIMMISEAFAAPLHAAQPPFWKKTAIITSKDPYLALAILSEKFADGISSVFHSPEKMKNNHRPPEVHPTAVIARTAELGEGVQIGAHCVVEEQARIGAGSILYPGCYVGVKASIGEATVLFPKVTVYEWTEIGNRVRLHAGCVLGADGFGYSPIREGKKVHGHQKIYHLGRVVIEDDVEIGANTCVDRATLGETRIRKNAKVDNLVMIGHNVQLDEGAIVCGGTALAGNSSVGKYAYVAGVCGIANHVHVGDGALVGAMTLVSKDVPAGGTAVGSPQREHKEHFRAHALLSKLLAERRAK